MEDDYRKQLLGQSGVNKYRRKLKKLIEFRNLIWFPSLATTSYAAILKEETGMTHDEIAKNRILRDRQ